MDGVARSKAELVAALPPDGMRRRAGVGRAGAVPAERHRDPCASTGCRCRVRGSRTAPAGSALGAADPVPAHLAPPGAERAHRAHGLRGAGLPLDRPGGRARAALAWRGEELPLPGGGFVVNDAYNANPTSMDAALGISPSAGRRRRVAILGGMAELGDHAERYHREIGSWRRAGDRAAGGRRASRGTCASTAARGRHGCRDADGRRRCGRGIVQPGDAVLVKASRSVALEGIAPEREPSHGPSPHRRPDRDGLSS